MVTRTAAQLRRALEGRPRPRAFVPTMGALHAGHAALISAAAADAGTVVVSIFVNPTQFGPGEDLDAYPRTFDDDLALCRDRGADVIFAPTVGEMYPGGFSTTVQVRGPLAEVLEGAHRPGHFDGVATVVAKLLSLVRPDDAYFGEKDWQQFAVVQRMVADLDPLVALIGAPTVREADGLALSSRNRYLSPAERAAAAELPAALFAARDALGIGGGVAAVESELRDRLAAAGFATDYAVVRDPATLGEPTGPDVRVLVAAKIGGTRLIDNVAAVRPSRPS